jgi:site-specific DNA-methyltransferase (adenine-specific)
LKKLLGELELNKIYHMDCLEGMKLIPDKSIDMILCDLPYGVTARNKWDCIIDLDKLWLQYKRIIKDNGVIALFAQTPFDKILGASNIKMLKYEWIWDKTKGSGFLNAKRMPLRQHENILVFYKKQPTYNPIMRDADPSKIRPLRKNTKQNSSNYGEVRDGVEGKSDVTKRYPTTILKYSAMEGELNPLNRLHPTQKPVELCEYLIKTYTNENDIVLDNCMGSGTTAVAAIRTNRKFIGFEIEKEYIEIANQRIESTYNELYDKKLIREIK